MNDSYKKQVALLIRILPSVYKIEDFAVHGGTAINLFHKWAVIGPLLNHCNRILSIRVKHYKINSKGCRINHFLTVIIWLHVWI